jgi:hypothetical protein
MTISKLIKELQKIEKQAGSRTTVVIDLSEFRLINNNYSHWGLHEIDLEWIRWSKDDNFYLKNGQERQKLVVSLK